MVRHQAPDPHFPGPAAMLCQQIAIKSIVGLAEEGAPAAIAALGDMVRMTGDDGTGEASRAMMTGQAR